MVTYYLKEGFKSLKEIRREAESKIEEKGGDTPYPSWTDLRQEDWEEKPTVFLIVRDAQGSLVRQVPAKAGKGLHRVAWDLRLPAPNPVDLTPPGFKLPWESTPKGPLVLPGEYSVTLAKRQGGELTELTSPQRFTVKVLELSPETTQDRQGLLAYQNKAAEMVRTVFGASEAAGELQSRIDHLVVAVRETPEAGEKRAQRIREFDFRLANLKLKLSGDRTISSRNEPVPWSLSTRAATLHYSLLDSQSDVPQTYEDSYQIAVEQLAWVLEELKSIDSELQAFEATLEGLGAPWTPGRIPEWQAP